MTKQPKQAESKAGRKETLTKDLAKKIVILVQNFPDTEIEVTWKNVIDQVKRRFGLKFHRNTLSQKEWEGEKLIAIAFDEAEAVQKRLIKENAPKYADNPRSRLRLIIAKLQAENLVLREQMAKIRAQQFDEVHSLLDLRTPLHRLVKSMAEQTVEDNNDPQRNGEVALSLVGKKATSTRRKAVKKSAATIGWPASESTDD